MRGWVGGGVSGVVINWVILNINQEGERRGSYIPCHPQQ